MLSLTVMREKADRELLKGRKRSRGGKKKTESDGGEKGKGALTDCSATFYIFFFYFNIWISNHKQKSWQWKHLSKNNLALCKKKSLILHISANNWPLISIITNNRSFFYTFWGFFIFFAFERESCDCFSKT